MSSTPENAGQYRIRQRQAVLPEFSVPLTLPRALVSRSFRKRERWFARSFQAELLCLLFPTAHLQISTYEGLQIAIDHAVNVANFHLGPVVLDQAIGLQHIRPNLRAEV